jgi:hypothetical protein
LPCVSRSGRHIAQEREVTVSTVAVLLLVLACPLMMVLMMRGHGHGGGHGREGHAGSGDHQAEPRGVSTDELRRRRDELERLIEGREEEEVSERELSPTGWRQ